jgi:hypothetical protein
MYSLKRTGKCGRKKDTGKEMDMEVEKEKSAEEKPGIINRQGKTEQLNWEGFYSSSNPERCLFCWSFSGAATYGLFEMKREVPNMGKSDDFLHNR